MQIIEKFKAKHETMYNHRRPVIAFLGDSVTQGCFEIFDDHGHIETKFCPGRRVFRKGRTHPRHALSERRPGHRKRRDKRRHLMERAHKT